MSTGWRQARPNASKLDSASIGTVRVLALAFIGLFVLPRPIDAQQAQAEQSGPTEEVIVRGQRSLRSMRAAIEDAEDRAYSMFNELNTDDDFDIVCRREEPTGSRISFRNCRARFVDRLLRESTEVAFSLEASQALPLQEIRHHMELLEEKIAAFAKEHPEFYEATLEVQRRKDEFAAAEEARGEP